MYEYQLTFQGESDAAVAEILKSPESVRSEYIEFGRGTEKFTGLAAYLTPANEEFYRLDVLREYGVEFLDGLSTESYYNRFIAGKPTDRRGVEHTVDHFLKFDGRYHTTIAVLHDNAMIAAASAFEPKDERLRGKHIAELSVTVADEFQRMGLGRQLLQRVVAQLIDDNFSHVMANFAPGNNASRELINDLLGRNNLVAGATNIKERYYRLGVTKISDDAELETMLRSIAGPGITKEYPLPIRNTLQPGHSTHGFGFAKLVQSILEAVSHGQPQNAINREIQLTLDIAETALQAD